MKLWDLENKVKVAKKELYAEKLRLHTEFRKLNEKAFILLDAAFLGIILFNMIALASSHAIVTMQKPKCLVEANPIMAEVQGLPTTPQANQQYLGIIFQMFMYMALWLLYQQLRRSIIDKQILHMITSIIVFLSIISAYDAINDLGYLLGMLL